MLQQSVASKIRLLISAYSYGVPDRCSRPSTMACIGQRIAGGRSLTTRPFGSRSPIRSSKTQHVNPRRNLSFLHSILETFPASNCDFRPTSPNASTHILASRSLSPRYDASRQNYSGVSNTRCVWPSFRLCLRGASIPHWWSSHQFQFSLASLKIQSRTWCALQASPHL